jgi:hypothetical protein
VATLGVRLGKAKLEFSSFTGREPNEKRFDFDKPRFDSWSTRLSFNPSPQWAMQVSHGFLESPEELHPGEDVRKTTASFIYSKKLSNESLLNVTGIWGLNKVKGHDGENAFLLEGSWRKNRLALHARYEHVQKSAEELLLEEPEFDHDAIFPVNALTAGFNYDLLNLNRIKVAGGAQLSMYMADNRLNNLYGRNPMAFEVYLRLYPTLISR